MSECLKERPTPAKQIDKLGNFKLYQDNDPKRTADICKLWILYHCPSVTKTPAQSPELNPIEHVWDYLQQNLHEHQISNKQDLRKYVVEEWTKIDTSFCKKFIQSMPNRLQEIIKSKGGPTSFSDNKLGAFRTSPVQSLYVSCNQHPLDLRRKKIALAFYFKILSMPSHSLKNVNQTTSMKRVYDDRSHNIWPFTARTKLLLSEYNLPPDMDIYQKNFLLFQPWNMPRFHYINAFPKYTLLDTKPRGYHRQRASRHRGSVGNDTLVVPLSDMKRVILHRIDKMWQESWNLLTSIVAFRVKPVIGAWSVMPMRKADVKLSRLHNGHTRFTYKHYLFGEIAPECPPLKFPYTVYHVSLDCPVLIIIE
ncbi:RNase H domain-containing protein [Trichonephila clavipes]|nr:RNase H domain-containing protein [Trichonephila clavipes]